MTYKQDLLENLLGLIKKLIIIRHHFQLSHWLIQGPHFLSLHHQFENDYNLIQANLDELVEHFLYHRGVLKHSLQELISNFNEQKFPEQHNHSNVLKHIIYLLNDLKKNYHEVLDTSLNSPLITTQDLLTSQARKLEQIIWFYEQMNLS